MFMLVWGTGNFQQWRDRIAEHASVVMWVLPDEHDFQGSSRMHLLKKLGKCENIWKNEVPANYHGLNLDRER